MIVFFTHLKGGFCLLQKCEENAENLNSYCMFAKNRLPYFQ